MIALFFGWAPSLAQIAAILLALVIVAVLATGLGLLFGAINVTFRDAQSFVEIIVMCAVWASPVMYQWQMVADAVPDWLFVALPPQPAHAGRRAVPLRHLVPARPRRRGSRCPISGCTPASRSSSRWSLAGHRPDRLPPTGGSLCPGSLITPTLPRIVVDDVHKDFKLRHTHSIKETFVAAVRRKPLTTDFHALDGVSFDDRRGRGRRPARLQRLGQVDDAQADLRRPAPRQRAGAAPAAASPASSRSALASTPTSPVARTSSSTPRSSA